MAFLTVAFKLFFTTVFFATVFLAAVFFAGTFFTAFFLTGAFFTTAFTVVFFVHFLQQAFFTTFLGAVFLTAAFFTGFFFVVIFLPFMDLLLITHPFVYDIKKNMSTKKCIFLKKNYINRLFVRIFKPLKTAKQHVRLSIP